MKKALFVLVIGYTLGVFAETIRIGETPFGKFEVVVPEFAARDFGDRDGV